MFASFFKLPLRIGLTRASLRAGTAPNDDCSSETGGGSRVSTKQRTSGFQLHHGRTTITLLNGKHSGRLGVITMQGPNGELLEVTDLERTLIDIVVRAAYAGGLHRMPPV